MAFSYKGIKEIAKTAIYLNTESVNIGARRLYNLIEKLVELESFYAPYHDINIKYIRVTQEYVKMQYRKLTINNNDKNIL